MALTAADRRRLRKTAGDVADAIDLAADLRAGFVETYVVAMDRLNARVDARMEAMEQEVTDIAVDVVPGSPADVAKAVAAQVSLVRNTLGVVVSTMGEFRHPGMKAAAAQAIRDVLDYHDEAAGEVLASRPPERLA